MDWVKIRHNHLFHTELTLVQIGALVKIQSLCAFLERIPTAREVARIIPPNVLTRLSNVLKDRGVTLTEVLNKVLEDVSKVTQRRKTQKRDVLVAQDLDKTHIDSFKISCEKNISNDSNNLDDLMLSQTRLDKNREDKNRLCSTSVGSSLLKKKVFFNREKGVFEGEGFSEVIKLLKTKYNTEKDETTKNFINKSLKELEMQLMHSGKEVKDFSTWILKAIDNKYKKWITLPN